MQQSLLGYDPKARGATASQQVVTLLRRKELPLKCRRPITTICEVALPVILCRCGGFPTLSHRFRIGFHASPGGGLFAPAFLVLFAGVLAAERLPVVFLSSWSMWGLSGGKVM